MRYSKWMLERLAGPKASRWVVIVALLLALPALFAPLVADDNVHASKWRAWSAATDSSMSCHILNDYFRFESGESSAVHREMERGIGAWWMAPDLKLAFWRPLSAATHVIDHVVWNGRSALMHMHTLLWFAALLLVLKSLYRRFLPPRAATLALSLYAWDDARGMVLSWVANRSALIAGVFGALALIAHDQWRRDAWRPGAWAASLLYAGALLSAEMGISTLGFLLGYAMFLDRGVWWRRSLRLLPYVAVAILWQGIYSWSGYGVVGSGFYVSPFGEPLTFAARSLERAPVLAFAQLTPFPADAWFMLPPSAKSILYVLAIASTIILARTAVRWLASEPQFGYWAVGSVFSLLPISSTFPSDRNLVFVGFGAAPLVAILLVRIVDANDVPRSDRVVARVLVTCGLVLAPLFLPAKAASTSFMARVFASADGSLPRDEAVAEKTLIVVRVDSEGWLAFNWASREVNQTPKPAKTRVLGLTLGGLTATRMDARTLRLHADRSFLDSEVHRLTRGRSRPFHLRERVEMSDVTVTIIDITKDSLPRIIDIRFDAPLESSKWLWMTGDGMVLKAWSPPAPSEAVVVPGATGA